MSLPPELQEILTSDPDVDGGLLLFKGTRVRLFDYIMSDTVGIELDEFLAKFPEVKLEQIQAWNEWDDAQRQGKDPDDPYSSSHCWPLNIFPEKWIE
ncbi:MAG TPA: DUF433 domain-containing protein [Fimbriimonadaceae bacterium]